MIDNLEKLAVNNSLEITKNIERLEEKKKKILDNFNNPQLSLKEVAQMKDDLLELDKLIDMMKFDGIEGDEENE